MDDYEKSFVARMARLSKSGVEFGRFAREAVESKFGGAADVVFNGLSPAAFHDPAIFVHELSRVFGRGAVGIYEPIMKRAELGLFSSSSDSQSSYESLLRQLGPAHEASPSPKQVLLHEHRIKDEEENYADEAD